MIKPFTLAPYDLIRCTACGRCRWYSVDHAAMGCFSCAGVVRRLTDAEEAAFTLGGYSAVELLSIDSSADNPPSM